MSDSPVGWGDPTMDGTGTGLERGGDPPEQDEAARQAAELLPCPHKLAPETFHSVDRREPCFYRPAVAAKLREIKTGWSKAAERYREDVAELRERIAALEKDMMDMGEEKPPMPEARGGDEITTLKERIAALEADKTMLFDEAVALKAENERLRAALKPFSLIEADDSFSDGTWVAKTLYCNNQVTAFQVRQARAALAGRKP